MKLIETFTDTYIMWDSESELSSCSNQKVLSIGETLREIFSQDHDSEELTTTSPASESSPLEEEGSFDDAFFRRAPSTTSSDGEDPSEEPVLRGSPTVSSSDASEDLTFRGPPSISSDEGEEAFKEVTTRQTSPSGSEDESSPAAEDDPSQDSEFTAESLRQVVQGLSRRLRQEYQEYEMFFTERDRQTGETLNVHTDILKVVRQAYPAVKEDQAREAEKLVNRSGAQMSNETTSSVRDEAAPGASVPVHQRVPVQEPKKG